MKKIIMILFVIINIICIAGCDNFKKIDDKYNSKLYYNFNSSLKEVFIEHHITNGSHHKYTVFEDDNIPEEYIILLKSEKDAADIFKEIPFEIDFGKQNAVMYIYTTNYNGAEIILNGVKLENNTCNIYVKEKLIMGTGSASVPTTKFLVVTLDKINDCTYNFKIQ